MEQQIAKFYAKWSPAVLAFCCLLLGKGTEAEQSAVEAFSGYLSRGLELDLANLPPFLFVFAIDAAKSRVAPESGRSNARNLEDAVALLPWEERSVFALRSAMRLGDMAISEIAEIPVGEVQKIWMNALFRLRELLHKDFFSGRKK